MIAQRGDLLGERLDSVFADVGGAAVLIGMDTPQVSAAVLDAALTAIGRGMGCRRPQGIVGPAHDGGFWLLGLSTPVAGLCVAVPMSRDDTCAALRASLARHDVRFDEIDELVDVDDFETAMEVARRVPGSAFSQAVLGIAAGIEVGAAGRQ